MNQSFEEQDFRDTHDLVNKRQRFQRRPKNAADLMGRLMARKGYGQVNVQDELQQAWASIVDATMLPKTRPTQVRQGILQVLVKSSVIMQQLEFQKRSMLKQLKQKLPKSKIKDLRFKVDANL